MAEAPWKQKMWGERPFWGVGPEFDPWWTLNEEQKKLQKDIMELCRTKIRPHAVCIQIKYFAVLIKHHSSEHCIATLKHIFVKVTYHSLELVRKLCF